MTNKKGPTQSEAVFGFSGCSIYFKLTNGILLGKQQSGRPTILNLPRGLRTQAKCLFPSSRLNGLLKDKREGQSDDRHTDEQVENSPRDWPTEHRGQKRGAIS